MGCCSSTEADAETDISYADWVEEHAKTDALNADWTEELPSTEDAKTDIAYAKWTDELPCPCSRQHSFTTGLIWEKVPVEPISCCVSFSDIKRFYILYIFFSIKALQLYHFSKFLDITDFCTFLIY
jgi:hypothetical protein